MREFTFPWGCTPLREIPLAILDLETTGFSPPQARITEIAIVTVTGGSVEEWTTLIDPEIPIPDQVVKLNGITDELVRGKPKIADVLPDVLERLRGRVFVAHNVPFDWSFLDYSARDLLGRSLDSPHMCTLHMARKYLRLTSNSLSSVASHLGVSLFDAHRAIADTNAVREILGRLFEVLDSRGLTTGGDLIRQGVMKTHPPVPRR